MSAYLWAMRSASVLLFVIALLTVLASVLMAISVSDGPFADRPGGGLAIWGTVLGAFYNAVWPLFGAAVLWRIDRWVPQAMNTDKAQ